jgi:hypothetical protein
MDWSRVRVVHERAKRQVQKLRGIKTFLEFEELYEYILGDIQLLYYRVENMMKGHHKSSLLQKYIDERNRDGLIAYIRFSRDCLEHTVTESVKYYKPFIVVITANGEVHSLDPQSIGKGASVGAAITGIAGVEGRVIPLPVKINKQIANNLNRDIQHPPTRFRDQHIGHLPLEDWLDLCLNFYKEMLDDLEKNT